jgi:cytoskeleton protein RodZ
MTEVASSPELGGVGAELARAREEQGLQLTDVAQQLKFAARQLEALEQERFDLLPGGTFVRGMVRNYARLLKVDAEPLLARLGGGRFDAPDSNSLAERYKQPVPFSDGARRSTFVYLGVSLSVLVTIGALGYQWYREHNVKPAPMASASKQRSAAQPARSVPPVQAQPAAATVAKAVDKAPEKTVAGERVAAAPEKPAVKEMTVSLKPVPSGVHRIVMRCEEEAWLEVKDAAGRNLLSSLNPPGCERVVQGRGPFTIVIGNASHVRVLHNDRSLDLQPHTKQDIARFTIP